jgi:hypothetical protein
MEDFSASSDIIQVFGSLPYKEKNKWVMNCLQANVINFEEFIKEILSPEQINADGTSLLWKCLPIEH